MKIYADPGGCYYYETIKKHGIYKETSKHLSTMISLRQIKECFIQASISIDFVSIFKLSALRY